MDSLLILSLDSHGVPHRWISWQHACYYYAKDQVAWAMGEHAFTVYGGTNRVTGQRSSITASSIIAIKGKAMALKTFSQVPPLNNRELFHRDRQICAYCADMFPSARLTRDHVIPFEGRGIADGDGFHAMAGVAAADDATLPVQGTDAVFEGSGEPKVIVHLQQVGPFDVSFHLRQVHELPPADV